MMVDMNLSQMKAVSLAATPGPWTYDHMGQIVWAESVGGVRLEHGKFMMAQVRGWGHLQYLPNAEALQDANGTHIATFHPARILLMCEALEAAQNVTRPFEFGEVRSGLSILEKLDALQAKLKALEE